MRKFHVIRDQNKGGQPWCVISPNPNGNLDYLGTFVTRKQARTERRRLAELEKHNTQGAAE